MTTAERTLESLLAAKDRAPLHIPVYPPSRPYYLRAVEDLEHWAVGLERTDPATLDDDQRQYLDNTDLRDIASVLRRLAESEPARRLIFFGAKSKPGPTQRYADRDYLVVFEYCLRQRLSKSDAGGKGRAKIDVHATAARWREWGIKESVVSKARTVYGKRCRDEIEFHVVKWMEPPVRCSLDDVLAALFQGVLIARGSVPKD